MESVWFQKRVRPLPMLPPLGETGFGPSMLMIEPQSRPMNRGGAATWLVTPVSAGMLRLEAMLGETRLELLAEAPPDRILERLALLSRRHRTHA